MAGATQQIMTALVFVTWLLLLAPTQPVEAAPWQTYMATHEARYLDELAQLVAIPSVSADPQRTPDVLAAAAWLQRRLLQAGMQVCGMCEYGGFG
jgi:hypothetical protein